MGTRIKKVTAETRAEIASRGGVGRAAALSAEDRAAIASKGAAATNSPLNYAQRIRRAWQAMPAAERRQVREVLAGCNGLFPRVPKKVTVGGAKSPRKVAPAPVGEAVGPSES